MSTLDCLPDPLLQQVVGYAGDDGTSLACMSASCSALRECCNKPALWRAALISRFGEENLPVYEVLDAPAQPQQLPGWIFVQGLALFSSSWGGFDDEGFLEEPLNGLALTDVAAIAAAAGYAAFSTDGATYMILPTRSHWQYSSSNPAEGTYIAEEEAEREGFLAALQSQLKDAPSAAGVWPPQDVPGWVYVPGVQQVAHPKHNQPLKWQPGQARPAPLCRLLLSEADQGKVITTSGRIIHVSQVWQPQDWKRCCSSSQGMYVPERQWREWAGSCAWLHATREAPTSPAAAVQLIKTQYADLASLRLGPCDMGGWSVELALATPEYSTSDPPLLRLRLETAQYPRLEGKVAGVLPGEYEVVWQLQVSSPLCLPTPAVLVAQAHPHKGVSTGEAEEGDHGNREGAADWEPLMYSSRERERAARAANRSISGAGHCYLHHDSSSCTAVAVSRRALQRLRDQAGAGAAYVEVSAGRLHVQQPSSVKLTMGLRGRSRWWCNQPVKGIAFVSVQLRRVKATTAPCPHPAAAAATIMAVPAAGGTPASEQADACLSARQQLDGGGSREELAAAAGQPAADAGSVQSSSAARALPQRWCFCGGATASG